MKFNFEKYLPPILIALFLSFVGWLFSVERSITTIKSGQSYLSQNMADVKLDVREIRKNVEEVLNRSQVSEEKKNGSDRYADEDRHIR